LSTVENYDMLSHLSTRALISNFVCSNTELNIKFLVDCILLQAWYVWPSLSMTKCIVAKRYRLQ